MTKWFFAFGLVLGVLGCAPSSTEIERQANALMESVVGPAIEKALAEVGTQTAQLTGQASAIEPGYRVSGNAMFGTGVTWDATVQVIGVSANIAGATQGEGER